MIFKLAFIHFFVLFTCFAVLAEQSKDEKSEGISHSTLKVTPSVCIVREKGQACKMRVKAFWESSVAIDACLYSNNKRLNCWSNQNKAEEAFDITLHKQLTFTLRTKQKVLVTQHVIVNASQSNKYRRRLRSQWSLF